MLFLSRRTLRLVRLTVASIPQSAFAAENISPLGIAPDWTLLERYQETMTHDDFTRLLESVYCTHGAADKLIKIEEESARILKTKRTIISHSVSPRAKRRVAARSQMG